MTDALQNPMRIFAREFLGIEFFRTGLRTVEITSDSDCRYGDNGTLERLLFQIVISWLAFRQAQLPAVIMDNDGDMIRVVKGRCGAVERSIIGIPFRWHVLPDQSFRNIDNPQATPRQ